MDGMKLNHVDLLKIVASRSSVREYRKRGYNNILSSQLSVSKNSKTEVLVIARGTFQLCWFFRIFSGLSSAKLGAALCFMVCRILLVPSRLLRDIKKAMRENCIALFSMDFSTFRSPLEKAYKFPSLVVASYSANS